jgi:hypothetical protein
MSIQNLEAVGPISTAHQVRCPFECAEAHMGIPVTWTPTTDPLHQIHRDLTDRRGGWPRIDAVDHSSTRELMRARADWCLRVRANYATGAEAAHLLRSFYALGAPVDLLSGASYVAGESAYLLSANIHILAPLEPPAPLSIPRSFFNNPSSSSRHCAVMRRALQLFVFNIPVSRAIYEAISAISSNDGIASLSAAIAASLAELSEFGSAAVEWLASTMDAEELSTVRSHIPYLMRRYESLCHGNPARLDALAGDAIVIKSSPGNLGTLEPATIAAIYYDGLASTIFPLLSRLGWDGLELWQIRHQRSHNTANFGPTPIAVAAVGIDPS